MAITRSLHQTVFPSSRPGVDTASGQRDDRPIGHFAGFVGASPRMRELYVQIDQIAQSRAPVFVTGESGTGKEVTAQAVHARSPRAEGPMIALNCSAIPSELMESEIFGHVRGAFTGAIADRWGAAEAADGGTLFLDEICEMDLALQGKLLRFLQTGTVRRVGDTKDRSINVRIVCATNRCPEREIEANRFREDLYYRLHVLPIHLPALRERRGDIPLLAHSFLETAATEEGRSFDRISPDAIATLSAFHWPGNVRQLENVIRRTVVMNTGPELTVDMLSGMLGTQSAFDPMAAGQMALTASAEAKDIEPFWLQERQIIEGAIKRFNGNIGKAAAALEISPSTIYRKRQAWDDHAATTMRAVA